MLSHCQQRFSVAGNLAVSTGFSGAGGHAVSTGFSGAGGHATSTGFSGAGGLVSPGFAWADTDTGSVIALTNVLTTNHVVSTSTSAPKSNTTFAALAPHERTNPMLAATPVTHAHLNGQPDNEDSEDTHAGGELHNVKTFTTTFNNDDERNEEHTTPTHTSYLVLLPPR